MTAFPAPWSVDIALSRRTHERIAVRRTDDGWLAERWSDPATRVLVLVGSRFPVISAEPGVAGADGGDPGTGTGPAVRWVSPAEAPDGERLLLGDSAGVVHMAVLGSDAEPPEDWQTLRSVAALLPPRDAGLVAHALGLAEWHRSHRFCPRCGGALRSGQGGHVRLCTSCGRHQFPRTDPAVIMLVTDGDRALLGRAPSWPAGRYSTLAGFVEPGESLEDAVAREVLEEAGVEVDDVAYFGNQPWPFPASLMVGFFARARTTEILVDGDELEDARWFARGDLGRLADAGELVLPSGFSISRSLVEAWYGGPLPGQW